VFFTVLILILLANLFVLKVPPTRVAWHYAVLLALLALAIAVPLSGAFFSGGVLLRYVAPCALALGPMFFAGVIFAKSFRDSPDPDMAFGSNIAGSVIGGLSESFSMLVGFRYLLPLAIAFYLLPCDGPDTCARRHRHASHDPCVALAIAAAIHALARGKPALSCAALGFAPVLKGVPILLAPIFATPFRAAMAGAWREAWRAAL
jgi:hypothetical protein